MSDLVLSTFIIIFTPDVGILPSNTMWEGENKWTIWLEEKIAHYAHFTGTENNGLLMSLFHEK